MLGSFKEICEKAIAEDLPVFYHKSRCSEKNCIAVHMPNSWGRGYYYYCDLEDWKAKKLLKKFKDAGVKIEFGRPVYVGERSGKPVYVLKRYEKTKI